LVYGTQVGKWLEMEGAHQLPTGTVTFLFSDIEESTPLLRRVGDDTFASLRGVHRKLLREAVKSHGGKEIETIGDGFFIAFESARKAVAAAADAQIALAAFEWPTEGGVRVRMGLHTAEPHLSEEGYVGVGVHRAARICEAARGGQILVSNATAGIIEDTELNEVELVDLGEHHLKGLPHAQRLFQLSVLTLPSSFGPPRTVDVAAQVSGVGTFLLTDLLDWRYVIRVLGDEASAALERDYQRHVVTAVEASNGFVLERAGDSVLAVFRSAKDAVHVAAALREALSDLAWPPECDFGVSIVIHSGRWSGDPREPNAATALFRLNRIAELLKPPQVLVSQATAALLEGDRSVPQLRNLGERALPDIDEPMRLYELVESD
jgi:class 3 adenylate cyclase